jgi:hypothetical protein
VGAIFIHKNGDLQAAEKNSNDMTTGLKWMMILCERCGNYLSHSLKYKFQLASKINPGTRLNQHCRVLAFKENLWSRFLWVWV